MGDKILQINPENYIAMANMIVLTKAVDEKECLEAVKYMDCIIENNKLGELPVSTRFYVYRKAVDLAKKIIDMDKALYYFDCYEATFSEEEKKTEPYYKDVLHDMFSTSIYSEYHSNEKQMEKMNEIYHLFTPEYVNEFNRDTSCFRDINVGFLSSDIMFHPVGRFLLSLFKSRIKDSGIKYFCYYVNEKHKTDFVTDAIKRGSYKFVEIVETNHKDIEKSILEDKLDILVDLNGVSESRMTDILSVRLAPIQLTWIGAPCTSAIANVDYTLVDPVCDPAPHSQRFYTEELIYMKKTFLCYSILYKKGFRPTDMPEPPCKKNGYITFAAFGNALKLTDKMLKAWAAVLEKVPCSRLAIRGVVGTMDEISVNGVRRKFIKNAVDLSRVDFLGPAVFNDYLAGYNDVDIVLDTFPFNGATTTCDALMMGVPVVSLYGKRHHERVGLSMLTNVGLEDLAAETVEEYVEKAVQLSCDAERLSVLKKTLKETFRNSPLCDNFSFKTEFESIMRKLHIRYCMENGDSLNTAEKCRDQITSEISRGSHFLSSLSYEEIERNMANYVKKELLRLEGMLNGGYKNPVEFGS